MNARENHFSLELENAFPSSSSLAGIKGKKLLLTAAPWRYFFELVLARASPFREEKEREQSAFHSFCTTKKFRRRREEEEKEKSRKESERIERPMI